jgi:hypothetical protein
VAEAAASEGAGAPLAAAESEADPPRGRVEWVVAAGASFKDACRASENVVTRFRGSFPAPDRAGFFPSGEEGLSVFAIGMIPDTSTMDFICPGRSKASRGPKEGIPRTKRGCSQVKQNPLVEK